MTETLAMHDRRVQGFRDGHDDGQYAFTDRHAPNQDPDLDQFRIPQGSLFIELFCPRSPNGTQTYPRDLYNASGQLNLGATRHPDPRLYPVWQIAILSSNGCPARGGTWNDINTRVTNNPDTTNFDPVPLAGTQTGPHYSIFDSANPIGQAATVERLVWFTTQAAGKSRRSNPQMSTISYYNKSGTPNLLNPGQYAVVGPRPTTFVGKNIGGLPALQLQRIDLDTTNQKVIYTPANGNIHPSIRYPLPTSVLPIICSSASLPGARWLERSKLSEQYRPEHLRTSVFRDLLCCTRRSDDGPSWIEPARVT